MADYEFDGQEEEGARRMLRLEARTLRGLRILWWNIEYGKTNQGVAEQENGYHPLDYNLSLLMRGAASPDVILLGEYAEAALTSPTLRALDTLYPHSTYRAYGENAEFPCGIKVYSKYPFELEQDRIVGWSPEDRYDHEYRQWWINHDHHRDIPGFARPLLQVKVQRSFHLRAQEQLPLQLHRSTSEPSSLYRPVRIVPIHLANPWIITQQFYENHYYTNLTPRRAQRVGLDLGWNHLIFGNTISSFFPGFLGRGVTGQLILSGTRHPLAVQLHHIHQAIYTYNTSNNSQFFNENSFIVLGDFNLPTFSIHESMTEVIPPPLRWFESYLSRLFRGSEATYPTPSGRRIKELAGESVSSPYKIDHAFASQSDRIRFREILPLRGSDHFPLYLVVED